ncbi:PTPRB [Mytilus coruscus]|uniref:protein-tyrosine-phosphatase n=1 Tax=Mytilus coruscus TaxID=42192 RepID=A0A6J8E982_MYTCO|nr:PTPRB [Mytilus coruscus]
MNISEPNAPADITVENETTTSISINIKHGTGMVKFFDVRKDEKFIKQYVATAEENTVVTIDGLTPGTLYNSFTVIAISNGINSSLIKVPSHATKPNAPADITIENETTTSIDINIKHGTGMVKYFDVRKDEKFIKQYAATADGNTVVTIDGLTPGTLYNSFTVIAISNGINSSLIKVPSHATKPNAPADITIENETTTSIDINIKHGTGMVKYFDVRKDEKFIKQYAATADGNTVVTIDGLTPGTLYNSFTVIAISNGINSSLIKVPSHATKPNAPADITTENETTTSIDINIKHGTGMVKYFDVRKDEKFIKQYAATADGNTVVTIDGLTPGTLYNSFTVIAISNGINSSLIKVPSHATKPNAPADITIENETTTSIDINIKHGTGMVKYFDVRKDEKFIKQYAATADGNTVVTIDCLTPGTLYNSFTVLAISNGINSSLIKVPSHATKPNAPADITIENETTTSIDINIKHGTGMVKYFDVRKDEKFIKQYAATADGNTVVTIDGLTPGALYNSFTITAISNGINSSLVKVPSHATKPNAPADITVETETTTSININIKHGTGMVKYFDVRKDEKFIEQYAATAEENTVVTIDGLTPGTLYNSFTIIAISNGINSSLIKVPSHATKPNAPADITVETETTTSIDINIKHGTGMVKYFDVRKDEKFIKQYAATADRNTVVTIDGLTPGTLYDSFTVIAISNGINSSLIKVPSHATKPNAPADITVENETTTSISINIKHGTGMVKYFDVRKDDKFIKQYAATANGNTVATIDGLTPGTLYNSFTIIAISNGINSSLIRVPSRATKPNAPADITVENETTTSININIKHGTGMVKYFDVRKDDKFIKQYAATAKGNTVVTIDGLTPGTLYNSFTIIAISNGINSSLVRVPSQATKPNAPAAITVENETTTSININIKHGTGMVEYFDVRKDEKLIKQYAATAKRNTVVTIDGLIPGILYNSFTIIAISNGINSSSIRVPSQATKPNAPAAITVENETTTSISINIKHGTGMVEYFDVRKDEKFIKQYAATAKGNTVVTIDGLTPGTLYNSFTIIAISNGINSSLVRVPSQATKPNAPAAITVENETTTSISINIKHGTGMVEYFDVRKDEKFIKQYAATAKGNMVVTIDGLTPGTLYNSFTIISISNGINSSSIRVPSQATIPSTPTSVKVQTSSNETMDLCIIKGNGGVENYNISFQPISKAKCAGKLVQRIGKDSIKIDSLSAGTIYNISISSMFNNKHSSPYLIQHATDPSPPSDVRIKDRKKDSATIEIVKGKGCVKRFVVSVDGIDHNVTASTDKNVTVYLISGLHSATMYPIKIYAVSNGASNVEMSSIQISLTTEKDPVPVAIGIVVGVLAALIVIIIVVFAWRRQALCFKKNIPKQVVQGNMNSGFEEEVELADNRRKRPVKLSDFHRHVEMMSRNTHMKFSEEFKELGILSPKHSTDESQIQENRPKNRYTNILPFDHSIVKLIGVEDEIGSDFINANYIPGKKSKREFIATQGPLPSTKEEMWRMIWEQNVSIVVMLTQLIERGRKKCEIYWPENVNENMFLGDIIVEVETISHLPNYTLRTIALRLGDVERRIKHYNYLAWPDMGTPKTTDIMINFVDTVRQEVKPNMNGPIVVHCSAGVGRTGTFIIMDILLQEIRSKCTEVDIFGMILKMRNYRLNMVQTEDQYIFIHNCVKDLIDVSDNEEEEVGFEDQHELPSTPLIKTVGKTTTSSTLQIINPAGKVRFYRIIINRNTSLPLIPYQSSTQKYNITNLKPGAHYTISAVAVSNGIYSSPSSEINVFTDNFSLKTVKRTTNSVTLEISSFDRYIKSYEIFLDGNLFKDVLHISRTQNETIQNLVPGTLYNVKVVVTADTENNDVVFDIATLPGQPRSISVLQGMNYSDITVVPPRGAVDFYTFLSSSVCLSSNMIKSSYILETISNKKNSLRLRTEPGVCCMLYVVAVSNNITSTPLNSTIKRPESVPGKVDYQYMHILENSVTIFWSVPQHPNGIVNGYILTFWSNNKIASIKFTCVDCPGANDCSFLSHQQIKSSTFTGSTTFKDIYSTIPFKWRQTKFIFTINKLQQYSNYSFTLWTSTRQGNGPVFSSSFRTVKGHTHESSSCGPIIAGAVVGSNFGTVIILVIGRFVYRWYYRRVKGNTTKPDGRSQQYEDISPETDANVYETLEIAM